MPAKLTQEDLIKHFVKIHGNTYDYSKVIFKNTRTKIIIVCKKHGEFLQRPNAHTFGQDCPDCAAESRVKSSKQFIKDATKIHGSAYDYSMVDYKNTQIKVVIVCKKHGEFSQTPDSHLHKRGCPHCDIESRTKSTKQFIEDAKMIHGETYTYSKTNYKNTITKIIIVCKKHGEFYQEPRSHLQGCGCPKCNKIILLDGAECDSMVEAFRYLYYKKNGINFLHNMKYGKELGNKKYDFYFPELNIYEEVTSYDFSKNKRGLASKVRDKYLKSIDQKRKYVENKGFVFRFIQTKDLTKKQKEFVFMNTVSFSKI